MTVCRFVAEVRWYTSKAGERLMYAGMECSPDYWPWSRFEGSTGHCTNSQQANKNKTRSGSHMEYIIEQEQEHSLFMSSNKSTWVKNNVPTNVKKERRREGRFFYALLPILPDFYFQPEKRHFFTIMRFRQNRIICRISISRLQKGISKVFLNNQLFPEIHFSARGSGFFMSLYLNTTHIYFKK
jgi:hypothetical protein